MKMLSHNVMGYLRSRAPEALDFWTVRDHCARPDALAACDTLYSLNLIGRMDLLAPDAGKRFTDLLQGHSLAGGIGKGRGPELGVHKTAYALGVLNVLAAHGQPVHEQVLRTDDWRKDKLLDEAHRPRWPWYFSDHAWRSGHWIGGIPGIAFSQDVFQVGLAP